MAIEAGDAVWYIKGDATGLSSELATAEGKVTSSTANIGASMATVGKGMTALGAVIVAPLALGVTAAMDFGSAMAAVGTLGVEDMDGLEAAVRKVAVTYGQDLTGAAEGAYQAISAGVDAAEAPRVLEEAAKAATAGQTDLTTAIELGTSMTNAFGLEMSNVSGVFDSAFIAVKDGVTTFEELASSAGKTAPAFAAAGLSVDEMYGSVAALTKGGLGTAESFTSLNAVVASFTRQGEVSKLETLGLQGALEWLKETTGGNQTEMLKFLGSTEAMTAALSLTGGQAESFTAIMEDMTNKQGAANAAFQYIADNDPAFAWGQMKAAMQDLAITVGEALLPALKTLMEIIAPIALAIADWAKENDKLFAGIVIVTGALGGLMVAIGPILMMVPGMIALFGAIGPVAAALGVALGAVAGVISGPLIAALAAVVAAGVLVVKNWDGIKEGAQILWEGISAAFNAGCEVIAGIFGFIYDMAANTIEGIMGGFNSLGEGIVNIFTGVWDYLSGWFSGVADWIGGILEGLGLINGNGGPPPGIAPNAEGGLVEAGTPIQVGERGPEMFIPSEAGRIMPTSQSGNSGDGGANINITFGNMSVRNDQDIRSLSEMIAATTARELRAAGVTP